MQPRFAMVRRGWREIPDGRVQIVQWLRAPQQSRQACRARSATPLTGEQESHDEDVRRAPFPGSKRAPERCTRTCGEIWRTQKVGCCSSWICTEFEVCQTWRCWVSFGCDSRTPPTSVGPFSRSSEVIPRLREGGTRTSAQRDQGSLPTWEVDSTPETPGRRARDCGLVHREETSGTHDTVKAVTAPFQHAMSTESGCECIGHALQGLTELDPRAERGHQRSTTRGTGGSRPTRGISTSTHRNDGLHSSQSAKCRSRSKT